MSVAGEDCGEVEAAAGFQVTTSENSSNGNVDNMEDTSTTT